MKKIKFVLVQQIFIFSLIILALSTFIFRSIKPHQPYFDEIFAYPPKLDSLTQVASLTPDGHKIFTDPNNQFSFTYPSDISTLQVHFDGEDASGQVSFISPGTTSAILEGDRLELKGPYPESAGQAIETYTYSSQRGNSNFPYYNFNLLNITTLDAGGLASRMVPLQVSNKKMYFQTDTLIGEKFPFVYTLIFKAPAGVYILEMIAEQDHQQKRQQDFNKIINSFQYSKYTSESSLPPDWSWTLFPDCKMKIPTPINSPKYAGFIKWGKAQLQLDLMGRGYDSTIAFTEFRCSQNIDGYSLEQLANSFNLPRPQKKDRPKNYLGNFVGNGFITDIDVPKSVKKITKWNQPVYVISYSNIFVRDIYVFIKDNFFYLVTAAYSTEDTVATSLINTILDNFIIQ